MTEKNAGCAKCRHYESEVEEVETKPLRRLIGGALLGYIPSEDVHRCWKAEMVEDWLYGVIKTAGNPEVKNWDLTCEDFEVKGE